MIQGNPTIKLTKTGKERKPREEKRKREPKPPNEKEPKVPKERKPRAERQKKSQKDPKKLMVKLQIDDAGGEPPLKYKKIKDDDPMGLSKDFVPTFQVTHHLGYGQIGNSASSNQEPN